MGRKRKRVISGDDVTSVTSSDHVTDGQTEAAAAGAQGAAADPESGLDEGPAPRNAANERERARMRVLSRAFTRLKTSLPWVPADTKLSKLDTLRLASCYIAHLSRLLAEDDELNAAGAGVVDTGTATDDVHSSTAAAVTTSTANVHPLSLVSSNVFTVRAVATDCIVFVGVFSLLAR